MKRRMVRYVAAAMFAAGVVPAVALAQWTGTTSTANLAIAARAGDQGLPRVAPTSDGGFYIMWVDNGTGTGTGYNWWLQRVDACGVGQWSTGANAGIEINPGAGTSTGDIGQLAVSADGNAFVAVPTDGVSPVEIRVHKISPNGTKLWGPNGVVLNSATTTPGVSKSIPRIAPLPDGGCAVGVTTSYVAIAPSTTCGCFELVRLDATGAPMWTPAAKIVRDLPIPTTATLRRPWQICDMKSGGADGSFIVSWWRSSAASTTTSNKLLYAQKFDGNGNPMWDSGAATEPGENCGKAIAVWPGTGGAGGGLQIGTLPTMLEDGTGGAVFGWYETGNIRRVYIQHVMSNGTIKWNNGATPAVSTPVCDIDTADPNILLAPNSLARFATGGMGFAYNQATGEYFTATGESQVNPQGNYTAIVQKFNSAGERQWGSENPDTTFSKRGHTYIANEAPGFVNQPSFAQVVALADGGCIVAAMDLSGSGITRVIKAAKVTSGQEQEWSIQPNSDNSTDKSRLTMTKSALGYAICAFGIGSAGQNDIYAQNINPNGTLGLISPILTSQSTNVRACGSVEAVLSVSACGPDTLKYQWRKGGTDISGATSSTLTFASAKLTDSGSYDCVISTDPVTASVTSAPIALVVCVADFNCSGGITIDDLFLYFNAYFEGQPAADINGGGVTIDDLFLFINAWFVGGC